MEHEETPIIITVGMGTCGISAGAEHVYDAIEREMTTRKNLGPIVLKRTGCAGACYEEVLVEVTTPSLGTVVYGHVSYLNIQELFDRHIEKSEIIREWAFLDPTTETSRWDHFFQKQDKLILRNCGKINPESIDDYRANNGYKALTKVLSDMSGEEVIAEITKSGMRGRGGAGFPAGLKWKLVREAEDPDKQLICNGDEGDPGAFMDRNLLEGDPHAVIEGMVIAAYAIGSSKGFIYSREEYPLVLVRLRIALTQAREKNFLGKNILGSGFDFDISIKEGAGAFVCGEETALIQSIEGKRGIPKARPPYPAISGLWGKPTLNNNVETYANVTSIILNGADTYRKHGTEKSTGTKIFAIAGNIKRGGMIEVPMGIPIKEVVYDIGGGSNTEHAIKAVQLGGPSGGVLPRSLFDIGIDFDQLKKYGAIMGSGGLVVMDETSCMVDIAKYFLDFTQNESCGKCTFCRLGTRRMYEILDRITRGEGKPEDLPLLEDLAHKVQTTSFCSLGKTAPNPVLTTLRYFRDEYKEHIFEKKCRALKCKELLEYTIERDRCEGCTVCMSGCAPQAISELADNISLTIDTEECINCGGCFDVCHFNAVLVKTGVKADHE